MFKKFITTGILICAALSMQAQLLYKIEGNGLEKPSYIFGTHHLAPLSTIDSVAGTREALEEVSLIVGEIDMTVPPMELAMAIQPHTMAPADSTLSKLADPETFARLDAEFQKWAPMPGLSLTALDPLKPMVTTAMVTLQMVKKEMPGYKEGEQLDSYFQNQGVAKGKTIIPLETAEQQASLLYDLTPVSVQFEVLKELLDNPEKAISQATMMNDAYSRHDLEALAAVSSKEEADAEFMKHLLHERNADWLTKLPAILTQGPSFIAVGALHLPGDNGILTGLRKLGYKITPID